MPSISTRTADPISKACEIRRLQVWLQDISGTSRVRNSTADKGKVATITIMPTPNVAATIRPPRSAHGRPHSS
jgi:hypothetical protein